MEQFLMVVITSAATTLTGAVVGSLVALAKTKGSQATAETKAMQSGMRCLLWRELRNIHAEATDDGGLTIESRRHLESVYEAYHGIGGNGTGTRLYEEAMSRPVKDVFKVGGTE